MFLLTFSLQAADSDTARLNDPKYLQAYYPLAGDARDYSGWERHGTWTSEAYTLGPYGKDVGNITGLSAKVATSLTLNTTNFTISSWFKIITGSNKGVIGYNTVASKGVVLYYNSSAQLVWTAYGLTPNSVVFPTANYLTWNHVCISKSVSGVSLYLNGKLAVNTNYTGTLTLNGDETLLLGGSAYNGLISSLMANTRAYNIALTASEVAALYDIDQRASFYVPQPESDPSIQLSIWNTVKDWSQANRTLTKFNVVEGGNGIKFDGASSNGSYVSTPDFIGTNDFTLSMWARYNSVGAAGVGHWFFNGKLYYYFISATQINIRNDGSTTDSFTVPEIKFPQWVHFAFTRSGNTNNCYVNGSYISSKTGAGNPTAASTVFYIGNSSLFNRTINGTLSGITIWNRILTADEIKYNYNQQVRFFK